jgi:hypothetical protein
MSAVERHADPGYVRQGERVFDFSLRGLPELPPESVSWGRKTWLPGKTLGTFISSTFGISQREQKEALGRISDAVAENAPAVREVMKYLAGFKNTGKRMLAAWSEEVSFLRDSRTYSLSPWKSAAAFEGIFDPPKLKKRKPSSVARSYWLTVPNPNLSDRCNSQTSWQYRSTSATRTGNLRAGRRTYPLGRIVRVDSLRAWRSDHFYLTFSIAKLCCTVPRERFSTMALQSFFSTAAISVLLSSTRSA